MRVTLARRLELVAADDALRAHGVRLAGRAAGRNPGVLKVPESGFRRPDSGLQTQDSGSTVRIQELLKVFEIGGNPKCKGIKDVYWFK